MYIDCNLDRFEDDQNINERNLVLGSEPEIDDAEVVGGDGLKNENDETVFEEIVDENNVSNV